MPTAPAPGHWPVDPQEDVSIRDERIWIDGCFDFVHHGHAGAMLQARQLGTELLVGIHSDEAILENKGPTVMNLDERVAAVDACRWSTKSIPHAPYVTQLSWISHYGCRYVVHGDDITSDSSGEDCYRFVKQAGRFKIVKRTPGISTTDLVGRMLLCTRNHFIKCLPDVLNGLEGSGGEEERKKTGAEMRVRIHEYASDESGHKPLVEVWSYSPSQSALNGLVEGKAPAPGQVVVYVDGGFDLFTPGHMEFLKAVVEVEAAHARSSGWFEQSAAEKRIADHGRDYSPVYLVAGIHDDDVVNRWKGVNYPIMNIFERGMCVLQCKYMSALVFSAPFSPSQSFLDQLPYKVNAVYHGPTVSAPPGQDPYAEVKSLGLYKEVGSHPYSEINATSIVSRILKSREMYEERQRVKGVKGIGEEAVRRREEMERQKEEQDRKHLEQLRS
ncbi:Ethanolamine-phosphate cytidylyltransferase [Sphaceloma murrayae]|uniref:ethanolamine-phosphate cytidylyltransferase n=1 Tax=Sphaceloma murrayae TaxID=2082308 RepID=A0A2K1QWY5_9PEZI|nr:Ethanolamine-phosphate cytidylyltransferase [Sphaceloma murrayae]